MLLFLTRPSLVQSSQRLVHPSSYGAKIDFGEAREDLKDIWRYIFKDSELAADRFIDELYSECARIFKSGHHGRNRPDIGKGVTSYAYRRYVLYLEKKQSRSLCFKSFTWTKRSFEGIRIVFGTGLETWPT